MISSVSASCSTEVFTYNATYTVEKKVCTEDGLPISMIIVLIPLILMLFFFYLSSKYEDILYGHLSKIFVGIAFSMLIMFLNYSLSAMVHYVNFPYLEESMNFPISLIIICLEVLLAIYFIAILYLAFDHIKGKRMNRGL